MSNLKTSFEKLNFLDVKTYINSGSVIFSSSLTDRNKLISKIELAIREDFNLSIPVTVISAEYLKKVLENAPSQWRTNNKEIYDNTIFIIPPTSIEEIFEEIEEAKHGIEKIASYQGVIYWSASLKDFNKTKWSKIAGSAVNNKVTIRNANTAKKLLELSRVEF